jgi:hypothetical protein
MAGGASTWSRQLASALAPGLPRLLIILASAYAACTATAAMAGVTIAVPWAFMALLGLVALPVARTITVCTGFVEHHTTSAPHRTRALSLLLGVAVFFLFRPHNTIFATAGAALWLGYATIWSLNYLVAAGIGSTVHDSLFRDQDLLAYRYPFGGEVRYDGISPLTRSAIHGKAGNGPRTGFSFPSTSS